MEFTTKPGRKVNRDGKTYIADSDGVIKADNKEIEALFKEYGFESKGGTNTSKVLAEAVTEQVNKEVSKKTKKKSKK